MLTQIREEINLETKDNLEASTIMQECYDIEDEVMATEGLATLAFLDEVENMADETAYITVPVSAPTGFFLTGESGDIEEDLEAVADEIPEGEDTTTGSSDGTNLESGEADIDDQVEKPSTVETDPAKVERLIDGVEDELGEDGANVDDGGVSGNADEYALEDSDIENIFAQAAEEAAVDTDLVFSTEEVNDIFEGV